ncbi:MAG: inositol monophosphatase family protein [Ignisphaera sp.]
MSLDSILINCVDSVRKYLESSSVSFDVIGYNPFGDVSKRFDVEAENILRKCIVDSLKDVVFIGEEEGLNVYGNPKWIVIADPVDGSTNFSFEIPWASISVAIAPYRKGATIRDVTTAIVAEIFRNRTYVYNNGFVKIYGASERKKTPAPIVLGYFELLEAYTPLLKYLSLSPRRPTVRSLGSAALDIVYVGLGNAEVFIDARAKLRNVDVAAAVRIATALGAKAVECSNGLRDALNIPIDILERVQCIAAAYDNDVLNILGKVLSSQKAMQ